MKTEELGFRCAEISQRHRLYGECYMVDIDFLVIEYFCQSPAALIEYKWYRNHSIDLESPSLAATRKLADLAGLPFFIAEYDVSDWDYRVTPINDPARKFVPRRVWLTEAEYVQLLHKLRGLEMPPALLDKISNMSEEDECRAPPQNPDDGGVPKHAPTADQPSLNHEKNICETAEKAPTFLAEAAIRNVA